MIGYLLFFHKRLVRNTLTSPGRRLPRIYSPSPAYQKFFFSFDDDHWTLFRGCWYAYSRYININVMKFRFRLLKMLKNLTVFIAEIIYLIGVFRRLNHYPSPQQKAPENHWRCQLLFTSENLFQQLSTQPIAWFFISSTHSRCSSQVHWRTLTPAIAASLISARPCRANCNKEIMD